MIVLVTAGSSSTDSSSNGALIGGVVAAILIAGIVVGIVIFAAMKVGKLVGFFIWSLTSCLKIFAWFHYFHVISLLLVISLFQVISSFLYLLFLDWLGLFLEVDFYYAEIHNFKLYYTLPFTTWVISCCYIIPSYYKIRNLLCLCTLFL